jgi:hypothetical protein
MLSQPDLVIDVIRKAAAAVAAKQERVRKSQRESNNTHVLFLRSTRAVLDAATLRGPHRELGRSFDRKPRRIR